MVSPQSTERNIGAYVPEDAKWSVISDAEVSCRIYLAPVSGYPRRRPGPSNGVRYKGFVIREYSNRLFHQREQKTVRSYLDQLSVLLQCHTIVYSGPCCFPGLS